jgi:hypothetical protein
MFKFLKYINFAALTFWSFSLYISIRDDWKNYLALCAFAVTSVALVATGIDSWLAKRHK